MLVSWSKNQKENYLSTFLFCVFQKYIIAAIFKTIRWLKERHKKTYELIPSDLLEEQEHNSYNKTQFPPIQEPHKKANQMIYTKIIYVGLSSINTAVARLNKVIFPRRIVSEIYVALFDTTPKKISSAA